MLFILTHTQARALTHTGKGGGCNNEGLVIHASTRALLHTYTHGRWWWWVVVVVWGGYVTVCRTDIDDLSFGYTRRVEFTIGSSFY